MFDAITYRQKSGIATGIRADPVIANLAIDYMEITIYHVSQYIIGVTIVQYIKEDRKRFLGGRFILWNENLVKNTRICNVSNLIYN